jgi:hypothetical protein
MVPDQRFQVAVPGVESGHGDRQLNHRQHDLPSL